LRTATVKNRQRSLYEANCRVREWGNMVERTDSLT